MFNKKPLFKRIYIYGLIKLFFIICMVTSRIYAMEVPAEIIKKEATESFLIEPYKKERDCEFIIALLAKDPYNFPDANEVADLDTEYVELSVPQSDGQTRSHRFKQNILVCIYETMPVGFVRTFDLSQGMPYGVGQIAQIAVKKEARHKGIGTLLLIQGIEKLKSSGVKMIILDTMANNTAAHALYEKTGFKKVVDADSHYLYSKELS